MSLAGPRAQRASCDLGASQLARWMRPSRARRFRRAGLRRFHRLGIALTTWYLLVLGFRRRPAGARWTLPRSPRSRGCRRGGRTRATARVCGLVCLAFVRSVLCEFVRFEASGRGRTAPRALWGRSPLELLRGVRAQGFSFVVHSTAFCYLAFVFPLLLSERWLWRSPFWACWMFVRRHGRPARGIRAR